MDEIQQFTIIIYVNLIAFLLLVYGDRKRESVCLCERKRGIKKKEREKEKNLENGRIMLEISNEEKNLKTFHIF